MEYKDPGRYIPIIFLGVPYLGFPVESLYKAVNSKTPQQCRDYREIIEATSGITFGVL